MDPEYTASITSGGGSNFLNLTRGLTMEGPGPFDIGSSLLRVGESIVVTSGTLQARSLIFEPVSTTALLQLYPGASFENDVIFRDGEELTTVTVQAEMNTQDFALEGGNTGVIVDVQPGSNITITSGGTFSVRSNSLSRLVLRGDTVMDARAATFFTQDGLLIEEGNARVRRDALFIRLTDSLKEIQSTYAVGEQVYVSMRDDDENISNELDEVSVIVSANDTGDEETVSLRETNNRTGEFFSIAGLPIAGGTPAANNGVLEVAATDEIRARYVDEQDGLDQISSAPADTLAPEIVILEGGAPRLDGEGLVNFGEVELGTSATTVLSVINGGVADLVIPTVSTTSDFSTSLTLPLIVPSGDSTTFTLSFEPADEGTTVGLLQLSNNDIDENPYDINLAGTGFVLRPEIEIRRGSETLINDSRIQLDDLFLGTFADVELEVLNLGDAVLNITTATTTGDLSFLSALPVTVGAGATGSLSVRWAPGVEGETSATLSLSNNDDDENPYRIVVSGRGIEPRPDLVVVVDGMQVESSGTVFDLGEYFVDTGTSFTMDIGNAGQADLRIDSITINEPFNVSELTTPTIAPATTRTLTIRYRPVRSGGADEQLRILSNDESNPDFKVGFIARAVLEPFTGPLGDLLNYLLRIEDDPTGLDRNSDGAVDIADLVTDVNAQPPSEPILITPQNGEEGFPLTGSLAWTTTVRTDSYSVWLWPQGTQQSLEPTTRGLTLTRLSIADLATTGTGYRWQVRAERGTQSTSSETFQFTTEE